MVLRAVLWCERDMVGRGSTVVKGKIYEKGKGKREKVSCEGKQVVTIDESARCGIGQQVRRESAGIKVPTNYECQVREVRCG